MQARKLSETSATRIQLSLRVRHPAIDPEEISEALGLEPEHCFKAGDSRPTRSKGRIAAHHTQTYWLAPVSAESWPDPIEPKFLAALAEKSPARQGAVSAEVVQAANVDFRSRGIEAVLFLFLQRLNARHSFLQKIQAEGGDVALILVIERESAADFTLPVGVARLLVQLGISIEFKFDS
ncbi:MAG: hypothetical protein ABJD53_08985 [Gammaproteobacteria bacterium]